MQGTYECVKVIGTFHRYGVQQSVDSNGTFYYRPVVYMKDCKDLNNIDLKMPEYLLFNLTKGFKRNIKSWNKTEKKLSSLFKRRT